MVSVKKKPSPKVAKPSAKGGKVKPKAGKEKAKKEIVALEVGQAVSFVGYRDDTPEDEQIFEVGDALVIKSADGEGDKLMYVVVKAEDSAKYDENPDDDSITGAEVHPSEIKKKGGKVKLAKPAPEPIKVVNVGDMKKLMSKGDPLATAQEVMEEGRKQFFYFGGILAHIYHEKKFVSDYKFEDSRDGFEEFCQKNFGMKGGQVRAYIDIYVTISSIPDIDVKRIASMGWAKAAEISRYITDENAEEVIALAEEKPLVELKTELKETYVGADGKTPSGRSTRTANRIQKVSFTFSLFEDQAATVKYVLETAVKTLGVEDEARAFEHIINEWAGDHLDEQKVRKAQSAGNKIRKDLKSRGIEIPTGEAKKEKATVAA